MLTKLKNGIGLWLLTKHDLSHHPYVLDLAWRWALEE